MGQLDRWLTKNNKELMEITLKICKNGDDYMDLYMCVVEQMLKKRDKFQTMKEKEIMYFFGYLELFCNFVLLNKKPCSKNCF